MTGDYGVMPTTGDDMPLGAAIIDGQSHITTPAHIRALALRHRHRQVIHRVAVTAFRVDFNLANVMSRCQPTSTRGNKRL